MEYNALNDTSDKLSRCCMFPSSQRGNGFKEDVVISKDLRLLMNPKMLVNYPSYQVGFKKLLSFNTKCSTRIRDQDRFDHCYKVKQTKQKIYDRTIWQHHILSKETKLEIKLEVSPHGHSNLLPLLDNTCSIHNY